MARKELDETEDLKAEDIVPIEMLSLTALLHREQVTKSCDVGPLICFCLNEISI
jgi:hypothetical protein